MMKFKRAAAVIAAFVFLAGAVPSYYEQRAVTHSTTALASSPIDVGADDLLPKEISTADDLIALIEKAANGGLGDNYYYQTADIVVNPDDVFVETDGVLSIAPGKTPKVLTPVASDEAHPFKGHYDGGGYAIRGLVLAPENGFSGLFGCVENAEIANVKIERSLLQITSMSGGIAAKCMGNTTITGCSFDGTVICPETRGVLGCQAGGIAGYVGEGAMISDCVNTAAFSVPNSPFVLYAGGIAGANSGTVSACVNHGALSAVSTSCVVSLGGLVGDNRGKLIGSINTADVNGEIGNNVAFLYAGGIAGENSGLVQRVRNKGMITAIGYDTYYCYAGGLVGNNINGSVVIGANAGEIYGEIAHVGGLVGVNRANGGIALVSECLNQAFVFGEVGAAGGLVGLNSVAASSGSSAVLSASLNLDKAGYCAASVGQLESEGAGKTEVRNVYVLGRIDAHATTLSSDELLALSSLEGLLSDAWVYPHDGFYPGLAIVRDLDQAEVVGLSVNASAGKVAFAVYNPGTSKNAEAVLAFYRGGRLIGTAAVPVVMTQGYAVKTVTSPYAAQADEVKIIALDSLATLAPSADMARF